MHVDTEKVITGFTIGVQKIATLKSQHKAHFKGSKKLIGYYLDSNDQVLKYHVFYDELKTNNTEFDIQNAFEWISTERIDYKDATLVLVWN